MRHLSRDLARVLRVLRRARTIAVIGASPRPGRHSGAVVAYLRAVGYEAIPIRPDRADVAGLASRGRLADVPGPIDLVVVFRRPDAAVGHVEEAALHGAEAVWLPPGAASDAAAGRARALGLAVVRDRCIEIEHRRAQAGAGRPDRLGVHLRRRKPVYEDDRKRPEEAGWTPGGGGSHAGGGGGHAVLDEKKMVAGRPSPRRGRIKPRPL